MREPPTSKAWEVLCLMLALIFGSLLLIHSCAPAEAQNSRRVILSGKAFKPSCSQSSSFINRTSGLTVAQQNAYDTMVCGMVSDGAFASLDALYIFAAPTTTIANLNLVSSSFALTPHGTCTFTANQGYQCNGTTGYFDTNFVPSTAGGHFALNSASLGVYLINNRTTADTSVEIGTQTASSTRYAFLRAMFTGSLFNWELNAGTFPTIANTSTKAAWAISRTGATTNSAYKNGSSTPIQTSAGATGALSSNSVTIAAFNDNGVIDGFSSDQFAAAFIGGGLTGAQAAAINNRINTFMTTLGINVY